MVLWLSVQVMIWVVWVKLVRCVKVVNRCEQSGILKGLCSSAVKRFKAVWLSMCGVIVYEG